MNLISTRAIKVDLRSRYNVAAVFALIFSSHVFAADLDFAERREQCGFALQILGLNPKDVRELSEEEVRDLYDRKMQNPGEQEAVLLLTRAYLRLGFKKLAAHVQPVSPHYRRMVEALYDEIIPEGVRSFDQTKRGELTAHKSIKYNLASHIAGRLFFGIPRHHRRLLDAREFVFSSLFPSSSESHRYAEFIDSRVGAIDGNEAIQATDALEAVVRMRAAMERYFKSKPARRSENKIKTQRMIFECVWLQGSTNIKQLAERLGVHIFAVQEAESHLRAALLNAAKKDPVLRGYLSPD